MPANGLTVMQNLWMEWLGKWDAVY
ncbi:protein of unknown function [Pseudomonas mediterranea]